MRLGGPQSQCGLTLWQRRSLSLLEIELQSFSPCSCHCSDWALLALSWKGWGTLVIHLPYHNYLFVWCMEVEEKYLIFAKKNLLTFGSTFWGSCEIIEITCRGDRRQCGQDAARYSYSPEYQCHPGKPTTVMNLRAIDKSVLTLNFWRPAFAYVNTHRKTPLETYFIYLGNNKIYCVCKVGCVVAFSPPPHE